MKKIILITDGQRSGKSITAERMALSLSPTPVYLATAHAWDDEFRQRIAKHQERRGACWTNIEEEKTLSKHLLYNKVVVVDCITLWCTNFFYDANHDTSTLPDIDVSASLWACQTTLSPTTHWNWRACPSVCTCWR